MQNTHARDGEKALLLYNLVKGLELSNPMDPWSKPTGNTCFVLTEVYETPAGVADHWKQLPAWEDVAAVGALDKQGQSHHSTRVTDRTFALVAR